MSYARRFSTVVTTSTGGAATVYLTPEDEAVTGRLVNLIYTKNNFANGVDFTITAEDSGQTLWAESDVNASKTVAPMQAAHSTAGVALTYNSTNAVTVPVWLAGDRIKVVVANGGNTTSGTFTAVIA